MNNKTPPPKPKFQIPLNILRCIREGKLNYAIPSTNNHLPSNPSHPPLNNFPLNKPTHNKCKPSSALNDYHYNHPPLSNPSKNKNFRKHVDKYIMNKMINKILGRQFPNRNIKQKRANRSTDKQVVHTSNDNNNPSNFINIFDNNKHNNIKKHHHTEKKGRRPSLQISDDVKPNDNSNSSNIQAYKSYYALTNKNEQHTDKMEDFVSVNMHLHRGSCFAVFDGHGGDKAAQYASDNLHKVLQMKLQQQYNNNNDIPLSAYENVFIQTFEQVDNEIHNKLESNTVGTTVTVLYIERRNTNSNTTTNAFCANVGDSKCYLITNDDSVVQLSVDHNCKEQNEVNRVKKAGGCVFNSRVFGSLSVTRSLGDKDVKDYGVCAVPSVNAIEIKDNHKYIVLASDGIWDVVSTEVLSELSRDVSLFKGISLSKELCTKLVEFAMQNGSMDNISCIVIEL
jgi:serine/threonine protein phosphatase PrpC